MIELNNITYSYDSKPLMNDFNLHVEDNKLTCLLGSSGCGKTTTLRLIAGLEIPQMGKVIIDSKVVADNGKTLIQPHKRNIGFIFQDLALWPHFTVYKNIAFGLKERGEKGIEKTVLDMLRFFNLEDQADKYPHQLSGGQKQLVAISRSLVLKPKILLMDEPLANLDVKLKRKILEHIKKLKHNFDLTIVYVTHDHREAFEIADKVVVLNGPTIEEIGSVDEIKKSDNVFVKDFLEY
ncbi:Putrescine transport ATP-binding protein PotA (TC 3.A.1.11.1) [hydrothermal vent metagenome]|uniref:Putrescine transport ATP-binding protein PotA (TC 3.A.1.11.1) n=1 Tax=hydrothermal vent metagenome TaxID=652676 RepID=A0A3B1BV91_9ZZZZ